MPYAETAAKKQTNNPRNNPREIPCHRVMRSNGFQQLLMLSRPFKQKIKQVMKTEAKVIHVDLAVLQNAAKFSLDLVKKFPKNRKTSLK